MKSVLISALVTCFVLPCHTQETKKADRLASRDVNGDGKLSREELGETFWKRAAGFDANGDGSLDTTERAALDEKGGGRDKTAPSRPGGANTAFTVLEFTGSNGETIRYSLFVPEGKPAGLPLVLCLERGRDLGLPRRSG